jgi:Tfp pilus assembly protein PilO
MDWSGKIRLRPSISILALAVLSVAAFWFWHIQPIREELQSRRRTMTTLQAERTQTLLSTQGLPELRRTVFRMEQELGASRPPFLITDDADLLNRVQQSAERSGLTLSRFAPQSTASRPHSELPVTLQLEGTFHGFVRFLALLGQSAPNVVISRIHLRPRQSSNDGLTIDCVATAYSIDSANDSSSPRGRMQTAVNDEADEATVAFVDVSRDPFGRPAPRPRAVAAIRAAAVMRPPGLPGLSVHDVIVKGTVDGPDGDLAVIQGGDSRAYIVRPGDAIYDGVIRTITRDGLLLVQQREEGVALEAPLEIWKPLRATVAGSK